MCKPSDGNDSRTEHRGKTERDQGHARAEDIADEGHNVGNDDQWRRFCDVAGLEVDEVRKMAQLQEENMRLKQLVAELTLDKTMLQDVLSKKW